MAKQKKTSKKGHNFATNTPMEKKKKYGSSYFSYLFHISKNELCFCIAMCLLKSEILKVNKYKYKYSQTMTRHL